MAKICIIKLSPVTEDGKEESIEDSPRKLEQSILTQLFTLADSEKKTLTDSRLCIDCIEQVENVSKKGILKFTKEDMNFINAGYKMTSGTYPNGLIKRPTLWWTKGKKLLDQLIEPKFINEDEEDKKKLIKKK